MNVYEIQVTIETYAKDDYEAIEKVKNEIQENLTEIKDIKINWSEEYN